MDPKEDLYCVGYLCRGGFVLCVLQWGKLMFLYHIHSACNPDFVSLSAFSSDGPKQTKDFRSTRQQDSRHYYTFMSVSKKGNWEVMYPQPRNQQSCEVCLCVYAIANTYIYLTYACFYSSSYTCTLHLVFLLVHAPVCGQ